MWRRLRATAAATIVATLATATVAAAVEVGSPGPSVPQTEVALSNATSTAVPSGLGAISISSVEAGGRSPHATAPEAVEQVLKVSVLGGELELATLHHEVTLERVPGSEREWRGVLPPVRVIDARGTHEGWTVRWAVGQVNESSAARHVRVEPDAPRVIAGLDAGLFAGSAKRARGEKGATLFGARPGAGGGTYEAGGTVTVRLPHEGEAERLVVDLLFSLA